MNNNNQICGLLKSKRFPNASEYLVMEIDGVSVYLHFSKTDAVAGINEKIETSLLMTSTPETLEQSA